jgi:hypothetical protein
MVDQQVLTPLDERSIMGTAPDQTSIMCYQLPGEITRDGEPILGGTDINQTDYDFVASIYPKPGAKAAPDGSERYTASVLERSALRVAPQEDWPEAEDVKVAL